MLQIVFGMGFVEWGLNKGKMTTMDMFSDGREPGDLGFDPMGLMKPVTISKRLSVLSPVFVFTGTTPLSFCVFYSGRP